MRCVAPKKPNGRPPARPAAATRSNSSAKSELVVLLRPTVIRDASIEGDFSSFRESLPNRDFFKNDQVYRPFSSPDQPLEPLQ